MDDLAQLANLIKRRNELEAEITVLIRRPASIGHLGEYIASHIFNIRLEQSATQRGIDGYFIKGPLTGKSVNIKWYAKREGLLDITPTWLPDYYLVLTGPRAASLSSRGLTRAWQIESVYLFNATDLVTQLQTRGIQIGIATSVIQQLWRACEIYPQQNCQQLVLGDEQRQLLELFR